MNINKHWKFFLQTGKEQHFSAIYAHYVDILYAYGIQSGFQEEMCKDAIQDVFVKLYTSRKNLYHIENPTGYLIRTYRYRLIDLIRKDNRTDLMEKSENSFAAKTTVLDNIVTDETALKLKSKVDKLLEDLTDQQREVVYMRYILELSYKEIAGILRIQPDSARKIIYRAIQKLRKENPNTLLVSTILLYIKGLHLIPFS